MAEHCRRRDFHRVEVVHVRLCDPLECRLLDRRVVDVDKSAVGGWQRATAGREPDRDERAVTGVGEQAGEVAVLFVQARPVAPGCLDDRLDGLDVPAGHEVVGTQRDGYRLLLTATGSWVRAGEHTRCVRLCQSGLLDGRSERVRVVVTDVEDHIANNIDSIRARVGNLLGWFLAGQSRERNFLAESEPVQQRKVKRRGEETHRLWAQLERDCLVLIVVVVGFLLKRNNIDECIHVDALELEDTRLGEKLVVCRDKVRVRRHVTGLYGRPQCRRDPGNTECSERRNCRGTAEEPTSRDAAAAPVSVRGLS